ncbi:aminomethyltransferase [Virgibacillus pantothenticus]|uniref:glycine cleavage system aminomethyltransferase GcvT n=1 Tax=Virgibacillus pantothenticus TaxID=1473 RepID=UPI001B2DA90B|nr:glycine cleavage system aminomethyltransferase GcvT [Virgibacillus pantothenticus]MBU8565507.1 glycine cleavage system aminomethyltransferase GcvT [Virgibacillus pantothenticus]MBU8599807.1 glycine cleavage system aminomethyltransferase GcvT [Virgibacillus pantothenticus]MBU8634254.1 glycine cleavage system aminomethyltransferase GcvT [Virgibacillus pantothenticus]MBU8641548.1 glycine cleavage system aminomethyltransferase GcvT [Virgibacillus pantothenticus]MBU8645999.1 glycine cleavage sys
MSELKKTPLYPIYEVYGAKSIDFGGWNLPVQFKGIKHEHEVTRTKAGLFDVSHMGEIAVKGSKSLEFLQKVVTNDVAKLTPKRAQYTFMCYEDGGTVDDFLIYMLAENDYLLVVNAANTEKDYQWLLDHNNYSNAEVKIENVSEDYAQLALQGPLAQEILQSLTTTDLSVIRFFRFEVDVAFTGIEGRAIVSRTGYTGEDGFEIYVPAASGIPLWKAILEAGKEKGAEPIGLGARDTLRFEAALPLYGQELSPTITPVEAGLTFAVKVNKAVDFIGKQVLKKQMEQGADRQLVGLEMIDKGIPRTGYEIYDGPSKVGVITSGTQSPTLEKNLGLALVNSAYAKEGTEFLVQVRKRQLQAKVVSTPFYKREK